MCLPGQYVESGLSEWTAHFNILIPMLKVGCKYIPFSESFGDLIAIKILDPIFHSVLYHYYPFHFSGLAKPICYFREPGNVPFHRFFF